MMTIRQGVCTSVVLCALVEADVNVFTESSGTVVKVVCEPSSFPMLFNNPRRGEALRLE